MEVVPVPCSLFPVPCSRGDISGSIRGGFGECWKLRPPRPLYLLILKPLGYSDIGLFLLGFVASNHTLAPKLAGLLGNAFEGVGVMWKEGSRKSGEGSPTPPRPLPESSANDQRRIPVKSHTDSDTTWTAFRSQPDCHSERSDARVRHLGGPLPASGPIHQAPDALRVHAPPKLLGAGRKRCRGQGSWSASLRWFRSAPNSSRRAKPPPSDG